jgi:ketosteroid isomerase-like protein
VDADEQAVLVANAAFYEAFGNKDYAAMDALWARSVPVFTVHPLGSLLLDRDEVMETWAAILGNPEQPRVISGGARAVVVGDLAYVVGQELVSGTPIVATNLFVREDGEWRMVHHHSSHVVMMSDQ